MMDDFFGPIDVQQAPQPTTTLSTAHESGNNNQPPEIESERTMILEAYEAPETRLRARLPTTNTISPLEQMAQTASFPLDAAVERIARRLASPTQVPQSDLFIVRGLSDEVPSDVYERTRMRQAEIQSQINDLDYGADQWSIYDQVVNTAMARGNIKSRTRAAECYRRLAEAFVPQPTVLKPASVSRALNDKWRKLLLGELQATRNRYLQDTIIGLASTSSAGDIDAIAEQYVAQLVDPMVQRQIGVIERSNYDESPLMWDTLHDFFDSYLLQAAEYLNTPAAQREQPTADEEAMTCFLANALELYAQPEFLRAWLPGWLARYPQPPSTAATLTAYVKRIVAYHQAQLEQPTAASYLAYYTPMTEADARAAYRTMLESDVALLRARGAADNARIRSAIVTYFQSPTADFLDPPSIVFELPRNTFELIDEVGAIVKSDLTTAYAPRDGDTPEQLAALNTQHAAELQAFENHLDLLEARLALYGITRTRIEGASAGVHGPDDPTSSAAGVLNDKWSRYDLSYPLDAEASNKQLERLVTTVARSAEDFDARAQQTRAHEIRRAIDRNYTLQVLERRRADLQWQLEQLTKHTADVPQRIIHNVFDQQVERLVVSIGLSPQLEKRILTMSESLLDPEERRAQDALSTERFRVTWFFKPSGNGISPGVPETVVRDVVLDPGHLSDMLMPFSAAVGDATRAGLNDESTILTLIAQANAKAGTYRVEVRREELGDASPVYRSLFIATIAVVARCMRDNALFEPLNTGESAERHTCCWQQAPPNREFTEYVEELKALVEHGQQAHRSLLQQRAKSSLLLWEYIAADISRAMPSLVLPLPLPPWGSSVPSELIQTSYESAFTLQRRFSFDRIYADFRRRVGSLLYYVLRVSPKQLTSMVQQALTYQPDELFNYYLDSTLRSVDGIARLRSLAAEYGIFRPLAAVTSVSDARSGVPTRYVMAARNETGDSRAASVYTFALRAIDSFETSTDERQTPPEPPNTMGVDVVSPTVDLTRSEPTSIRDESLLAILQRLAHPLAQALMTERERAFFGAVAREFTSFSRTYRRKQQLDAPWLRAESTITPPLGLSSAPILAGLTGEIDDCVDAELGSMTVEQIERELAPGDRLTSGVARMFFDAASYAEYRRLAQNCLHEDDFAQLIRDRQRDYDQRRFTGNVDIRFAQLERLPPGACCLDNLALPGDPGGGLPMWTGAHSAITDQPVPLVVQFSNPSSLGPGIYQRASLVHAGSQPTHRNIDFNGLRNLVEQACARYNTIVDEYERRVIIAPTPGDMRQAILNAQEHCEQLQLVYNYFAFAAPPVDVFYEAHALIREIQLGTHFRRLSFALPLEK